jgi:hypothetical protein
MRKLALVVLLATSASADPRTDLRSALSRLPATAHVHGVFDVTSTSKPDEDEPAEIGKASVGFETTDSGLRLLYGKTALAAAVHEARAEANDPERPTPTRLGFNQVRPLHIADLVDAASYLTVGLENAQVVDLKPGNFHGRAARILTLKISPKMSKREKKHMKKFDMTMMLWLGDDGVPLAAERKTYWKASILLISLERDERQTWTYTRTADRLIATKFEEKSKSKGLGQNRDSTIVEVLTLQ